MVGKRGRRLYGYGGFNREELGCCTGTVGIRSHVMIHQSDGQSIIFGSGGSSFVLVHAYWASRSRSRPFEEGKKFIADYPIVYFGL